MAHGITNTDEMFSVRETPWHGKGVILDHLATGAEAIAASKTGWIATLQPTQYFNPVTEQYEENKNSFATVRSDNGALLGTVGKRYVPFQNTEAVALMDEITQDPNGPKYTTGGSLFGGSTVWYQLEFTDSLKFAGGNKRDPLIDRLLLSNSHDGSSALLIGFTQQRVVCSNTLNFAKSRMTKADTFRAKHTEYIRDKVKDIQNYFGIIQEDRILVSQIIDNMRTVQPTKEQIDDVMSKLFDKKKETEDDEQSARTRNIKGEIIGLFRDGEANRAAGDVDSAWAFLNGITEYANVKSAKSGDDRLNSIWFGASSDLNARAFDLIANLK